MDQSYLKSVLNYDPETGVFTWLVRPARSKTAIGAEAGCINAGPGYRFIKLRGVQYYSHRLAWLYMTGAFPPADIDHVNGDRLDNRFCNLREATRQQNCANRSVGRNSTTGVKGVSSDAGSFRATIHFGGRNHRLGNFKTVAEAANAYDFIAKALNGAFAHQGG